MRFEILGVDRTVNNLMRVSSEIKERLRIDAEGIGEDLKFRLLELFSGENIEGGMTGEFEYTLTMKNIIICVVSGRRVLIEREKIVGRDWSNMVFVDYEFLKQEYLAKALFTIQTSLNQIISKWKERKGK